MNKLFQKIFDITPDVVAYDLLPKLADIKQKQLNSVSIDDY